MKCSDSTAQMIGQFLVPSATEPETDLNSPASLVSRYRLVKLLLTEPGKRTFLAVDEQAQTQVIVKIVLFGADPIETDLENQHLENQHLENQHLENQISTEDLNLPTSSTASTDNIESRTVELETVASKIEGHETEKNVIGKNITADNAAEPFLESLFEKLVMLPYLDSFEVETPLGAGLALIKLYTLPTRSPLETSAQSTTNRGIANPRAASASTSAPTSAPTSTHRLATSVTRWPRMSCADIIVRAVPDKMEVRCIASRIREGKILPTSTSPFVDRLEIWLVITLATFGFVGGAVISTGSIAFGIVVAAILPLLFQQLTAPKTIPRQQAILRFSSASGRQTFLSLTTLVMPPRTKTGRSINAPTQSKLHSSRLSIRTVKLTPALVLGRGWNPIGAEIVFTFYNRNAQGCDRLRIAGSYAEMRWLSRHLSNWSNARNIHNSAQYTP
ncbi:MAG: hypothetical protein AAFS04_06735 [Cyanobacteria bacterium J06631_9]